MELTTLQAVDLFLESLHTRFATRTIKLYRLVLQQFLKQAPNKLSEVTTDVIFAFLDGHVQHNPAIRQQHAATLKALFFWLIQQGIIQSNPMEQLAPIGYIERISHPLDPDDVTKILKAIPTSNLQDRAIFTLIFETGMRVGDYIG